MHSPMLFQKPFDLHTNKAISYGWFKLSTGIAGVSHYSSYTSQLKGAVR
jgi:hypothetical protein